MYVCICRAITEKDIEKAVGEGICSLEKLSEVTSVSKDCGCCTDYAHQVLEKAIADNQGCRAK